MLTINETTFKTIGKNITKNIKDVYGKDILSLSEAYELLAKSMGYKDFNSLKSIVFQVREGSKDEKKEEFFDRFDLKMEEFNRELLENFPSIDNLFVPFKGIKSDKYDTFIHHEISGNGDVYYLISKLKNSPLTNRVFYSPEYESFSLFVYPNIQEAYDDYYFSIKDISDDKLDQEFFSTIKHLNGKNWFDKYLLHDLMNLMEAVKRDREIMGKAIANIKREILEELYLEEKPKEEN